MTEESIIRLKKGDRKAFREVFDSNYSALCVFGNRYISDSSELEDLVQDVFISFWEQHQNFDHSKALKAFLYTSVRNKCINYLKHQAVLKKNESALIYELESNHFFTQHVIEEETFNQLYQEIQNLPDSAQKIMLLALKGLKNKEIAEELGISENTVKTQKKISYSKLKENLKPVLSAILLSL